MWHVYTVQETSALLSGASQSLFDVVYEQLGEESVRMLWSLPLSVVETLSRYSMVTRATDRQPEMRASLTLWPTLCLADTPKTGSGWSVHLPYRSPSTQSCQVIT